MFLLSVNRKKQMLHHFSKILIAALIVNQCRCHNIVIYLQTPDRIINVQNIKRVAISDLSKK